MNKKAIEVAKDIKKIDSKAAKWIASDATRELTSEKVQEMLKNKYNYLDFVTLKNLLANIPLLNSPITLITHL